MVKDALFYIQQKGSLTPQLFFHQACGRAPAAVDNHGDPQGGRGKRAGNSPENDIHWFGLCAPLLVSIHVLN